METHEKSTVMGIVGFTGASAVVGSAMVIGMRNLIKLFKD